MQSATGDWKGRSREVGNDASPTSRSESESTSANNELDTALRMSSIDLVGEKSTYANVDQETTSPQEPDADDTTSGHHSFDAENCQSDNEDEIEVDVASEPATDVTFHTISGTDVIEHDRRSPLTATMDEDDDEIDKRVTGKVELDDDEDEIARQVRQNQMYARFQAWALRNYGETGKTKTVTRTKYDRVVAILSGREPPTAENSKLRFWIKAKGFRLGASGGGIGTDVAGYCGVLFIPAKNWGGSSNDQIDVGNIGRSSSNKFKRVAVVEDFFEIIYNVHVEMDGRGGKHAGQKRTYRAIAETYAFLPREAVTKFLMSCADCQKRMHLTMDNFGMVHSKGVSSSTKLAKSSHTDGSLPVTDISNGSVFGTGRRGLHHQPSGCSGKRSRNNVHHQTMTITDYNLPITVSYMNYIKQRKKRKARASTNLPGNRKRSKLATTADSYDPSGRNWNYHQFDCISPSNRRLTNDESTMNAFAEALSMASRDKATFCQSDPNRSSGGSVYDRTEHIDGDEQTDKHDEYLDDEKQDNENVLPIDLSITTVVPPGERSYSATTGYDWQSRELSIVHNREQTSPRQCSSAGDIGIDTFRCLQTNEEDVSCDHSLSVGADDDDSRSVGLPEEVAAVEPAKVGCKHSMVSSTKTENPLECKETSFTGTAQSPGERAIATQLRGNNGQSPSAAEQLVMLLASQDANSSLAGVYENSAFQAVGSVSIPRASTGNSQSPPSKPIPIYHCSSPPPLVLFTSGMYTLPDRSSSSTLAVTSTTSGGSTSMSSMGVNSSANAVVGHVPLPSIDFDLVSLHDAIALATAAAATQVQTVPSLAAGMPPPFSQTSLLSTMYRHPAIVISSPDQHVSSLTDNPFSSPSSTEPCGFKQVFGGGTISADGLRRYGCFQPPPLDGDLALAALMAPITAAAAAAATVTAFSSGLTTSRAQSASMVAPPGDYHGKTSFDNKELAKDQSPSNDKVGQTTAPRRHFGSRSSPVHFTDLYRPNKSTMIPSYYDIASSTPGATRAETTPSSATSSTRLQRQQQQHQHDHHRRSAFQADGLAAIRQIIAGYRDSAAFLCHSADELELLLAQQQRQSVI